jgi:prevent-host-death family protein
MALTVNIHEAKTNLSQLIKQVEEGGKEIIIARGGKPAARLMPIAPEEPVSRIGFLKGQFNVPDDFDTMLEAEIEEMFYGDAGMSNQ